MRSIVSLSGGLDSSTVLGIALAQGHECFPITFDYGQLHKKELIAMYNVVSYYKEHYGMKVRMPLECKLPFMSDIGGSALTDKDIEVPEEREEDEMTDIPVTYVPGRNTMFVAIALSYAESIGADIVALGANAIDYSGYPDCRPEYFAAWNELSKLSSKQAVEGKTIVIKTPIIGLTKAEIIEKGLSLDVPVPYHLTWSCYKGEDRPCGVCDSCILRAKGFEEAGYPDPSLKP